MRKAITLITVALLLYSSSATAGLPRTQAQRRIEKVCSEDPLRTSSVAILALRMNGDTLACVNPRQKMVPASNVKLLTTGAALKTLGAGFRFETRLGYAGKLADGVLDGDLYIIGGGDPTTGSKASCAEQVNVLFSKWKDLLTTAGIREITGSIVADPRFFLEPTPESLGWTYDDIGANYGAAPLGINFFENAQNFYVTPGAAPLTRPYVTPRYPDTPWMKYVNDAVTGAARSENELYVINTPFGPYGQFIGSFPLDRKGYTLEASNRFGAYTCAFYFYNYLKTNGLTAKGGYADVTPRGFVRRELSFGDSGVRAVDQDELTVIGSTYSAPLSDIVRVTNCESNNFFAETLFKMLEKKGGMGDFYKTMGLRTSDSCQQIDGSGLSRKNYVSADFFVRFLGKMADSQEYDSYFKSLPVPGSKGTLENLFPNASPEFRSRIHMKSGSMNGVRCYSGYIVSPDGDPRHTVVFSVLLNNLMGGSWLVNPSIYGIIEALAAEN